jgi:ABC-type Fe3+/spermidine/putrescine transport system ATPase subunit
MLTVNKINKNYEGRPLLREVNFDVASDETICLLGASGSGKSTLLRIIAGLEEAESGEVLWDGQNLLDIPAHQRNFGLMFQDYALFPHRTVAENIAFGLRMQNRPKEEIKTKVLAGLKTINMAGFANRKVTELSGGEQQRVALARALAPEPRLLMLDEPLGALDRALREQLSHELRRILRETGIPAIYVTHDQEEAFAIADRLLLLHDGAILQSGRPHDFFRHPRNAWVAGFFGLGNLISGTVTGLNPLTLSTPLGIIRAHCDSPLPAVGEKRTLLFRPGDALPDTSQPTNRFAGVVVDQVFQGENYRLTLKINGEVPSFDILLKDPRPLQTEISIHYNPGDVLCLNQGE